MSLQSRLEVVAGGESGQKKFLRETLALIGVHNSTKASEKRRLSADGLPGSLRNHFLPSSPREGDRPGLKTRRLSPFRPACGG